MAISLSELKKQIVFDGNLVTTFRLLQDVSLGSYHNLKNTGEKQTKDFLDGLERMVALLPHAFYSHNPFVHENQSAPAVYVLFSSDSGLLGGLNQRTIREYDDKRGSEKMVPVTFVVGQRGISLMQDYPEVVPVEGYESEDVAVQMLRDGVLDVVKRNGGTRGVFAFYPHSGSFASREVKCEKLLPCSLFAFGDREDKRRVLVESDPNDLVRYVVGSWLDANFYRFFREGHLSEYSARAVHLQSAIESVKERLDKGVQLAKDLRGELIDKQAREAAAARKVLLKSRERKKRKARELAEAN